MFRKLLILLALVLLCSVAQADTKMFAAGAAGLDMKNIKTPGMIVLSGWQTGTNKILRVATTKINVVESETLDNMLIGTTLYLNDSSNVFRYGIRSSGDIEFDDGDIGFSTGVEIAVPHITTIMKYDVGLFLFGDAVTRPDVSKNYYQVGVGLLLEILK
jgi:hypothetical protein